MWLGNIVVVSDDASIFGVRWLCSEGTSLLGYDLSVR
jgi:hypothetical protein